MEKYRIYEGHMGGFFWTPNEPISEDDLYCETCGDGDWEIGILELDHEPSDFEMAAFAEKEGF